jgi:hypothetical protein
LSGHEFRDSGKRTAPQQAECIAWPHEPFELSSRAIDLIDEENLNLSAKAQHPTCIYCFAVKYFLVCNVMSNNFCSFQRKFNITGINRSPGKLL